MVKTPELDVVTIGEAMLRLAAIDHYRLEQTKYLEVSVGGSEANFAISLARLGVRAGWVSKVVDNQWGRRILGELRWHGIDTSRVIITSSGRVGLNFVEKGSKPRASEVIYDREFSAASGLTPGDIDWDYLASARHVHLTGITAALSNSCRDVVTETVNRASAAKTTVSFDVNYRQKLWSTKDAFETLDSLLPHVTVLITTYEDAIRVFGLSSDPQTVCQALKDRYGCPWIVVTLGSEGSIGLADGEFCRVEGLEVDVVDRVGAGDTFASGCVYGFLEGSLEIGLNLGTRMAAYKHSIVGDVNFFTLEDISRGLTAGSSGIRR